ncbi:LysR family transcriptional regulator [Pantoea sp.]|uniref:LysR family transcriptional regulator n=1 Tax=Pantoea sp. TaxID=69393 RepID=UPI002898610F|nr:LysR family transcriptional regulator [Pantoea sp.]
MFISKAMRVFVTVYREKSLKSAAEQLCLTVPPVSRMLKILEERIGEKLFIIERNRIRPTHAAECLYNQILPHYCALEKLKKTPERSLKLSSPYLNTLIVTDLFETLPVHPEYQTLLRQADGIQDDDDIFISLHSVASPSHFLIEYAELTLSLCCITSLVADWKKSAILAEQDIICQPGFQKALEVLRTHGFKGNYRRIDNPVVLQSALLKEEGIIFRIFNKIPSKLNTLPYIYRQPIFIYTNQFKKNSFQEEIVTGIKKSIGDL